MLRYFSDSVCSLWGNFANSAIKYIESCIIRDVTEVKCMSDNLKSLFEIVKKIRK